MKAARSFLSDNRGAGAAEFALVLPLALLLLFGIIDTGRYAWALTRLEKATQMGARYAVATRIVPQGLNEFDYVGETCDGVTLEIGTTIPAPCLGTISCDATACVCAAEPCPPLGDYNDAAYDAILARMRVIEPRIDENSLTVEYSGSGLGFAGDPAEDDAGDPLSDIAPLVTVRLSDLDYAPITLSLFGGSIDLPDFSYSLTLEDGDGSIAS